MVGKDGTKSHSPSEKNGLLTKIAQTPVAMNYFDRFPDDDVPEHGEEGEDRREGRFTVDDEEGHMVDF